MTSTAATTQINVRIERSLKDSGDAALLNAGVTPSEAIRALWELAANLKESPRELHGLLFPQTAEQADEEARRRAASVERARAGQAIVSEARCAAGIAQGGAAPSVEPQDDELYTEALLERFGERWSL